MASALEDPSAPDAKRPRPAPLNIPQPSAEEMAEMLKVVAQYTNTRMRDERRAYLQSNMRAIIRAVMPDLNTAWTIWRTRTRQSLPQPPSSNTPHNCQGWTPRITDKGAVFDLCCEQQEVRLVWYASTRGNKMRFTEMEMEIELDGEHMCWEVCVDRLSRKWETLCYNRSSLTASDIRHRTSLLQYSDIYLCISSGRWHVCGDLCNLPSISPSHAPHELRCPLTNLVLAANVDSGVLPPPVDAPLARTAARKRSSKPSVYEQKLRSFEGVMNAATKLQRQTCRPQLFGESCGGWVIGPLPWQTMGIAPEALAVVTPPTGHPERCSTATLPNEVCNVIAPRYKTQAAPF
jgi:hypothetical protein